MIRERRERERNRRERRERERKRKVKTNKVFFRSQSLIAIIPFVMGWGSIERQKVRERSRQREMFKIFEF